MDISAVLLFSLLTFLSSTARFTAQGRASYYADHMQGQATASGEPYDKASFTAAHATLPFNTRLLVRNLKNGKTVVVRVNDRKARHRQHIIDLSRAAAEAIGMVRAGSAVVRIKEVKNDVPEQQAKPAAVSES